MSDSSKKPIGGGFKKVLYTLDTVRRIGPITASKALSANNTCKACGLGMGGQKGGMVNELGEFPSVCNKSVQAHSSDIQPAIPLEIFNHSIDELSELSGRELDRLGRLTTPLVKKANSNKYQPVSWDEALQLTVDALEKSNPERTFFYSSGRSSNEAGFIFQLLARIYGTNNVTNCSYYCHQATSVGLSTTIGTGTATVELADLGGADLVFVIGANPASNHPRFIHQLKAVRDRGGEVIVINPAKESGLIKFAVPKSPKSMIKGGDEIASCYLQPNIGTDVTLLVGIIKAVIELDAADINFIQSHTEHYDKLLDQAQSTNWESIESTTGVKRQDIEAVAKVYAQSNNAIFAWGMGLTHHSNGVENVEYVANLALLRGMVGRVNAGLLPLRGHSNVQGIGTIGVKPVLTEEVMAAMEHEFDISLPRGKGLDTLASIQAANNDLMDAALIMGGNLYAATPDSSFAKSALNKIQHKTFLTTSLNSGHVNGIEGEVVILPVTARDEEWSSTTQESMFNYVRLSDGGINRYDTVRPESVILTDLMRLLFPELPFDTSAFRDHQSVREAIARIVPGMEQLKDIAIAKEEFHIKGRIKHSPEFNTTSEKASFVISELPELNPQRPFRLTTIRSEGQFNSIIYEEKDSYRNTDTRWSVLMCPSDMEDLALKRGDTVDIISDTGTMASVAVFNYDLPRGNVMSYYPEANILTSQSHDPRSKTPAFKNIPVDIKPTATAK